MSPKKKKRNTTYFDMRVKHSDDKHRLVSLNPRFYDTFLAAEKGQHVIKLSNFKRTRNRFDCSKTDLIINEQHVEKSDHDIPYLVDSDEMKQSVIKLGKLPKLAWNYQCKEFY